jgi:ketosteroid isomerase-like protein
VSNIETVKAVYEAFGRGDIPAIMDVMADDIEWEYGMADNGVPWLRSRAGRDGTGQFFASLAGVEFHTFEPRLLLEGGDMVVSLIDVSFTVKKTGVLVSEEDEVHIWTFGADGKASRFCHKLDTHQHRLACGGDHARQVLTERAH